MDELFWRQQPQTVAQAMLGKLLVVGETEGWVLRTEGSPRAKNATGIYKPMLEMAPGDVYCPRTRNSILLLIVTQDGVDIGGCVLIRSAEIGGTTFDGPGKVTEAFGITVPRVSGTAEIGEDDDTVLVHLGTSRAKDQPKPSRPRLRAYAAIGWETVRRNMPRIAKCFLSQPLGRFEDFLERILEGCTSEMELLKRLR